MIAPNFNRYLLALLFILLSGLSINAQTLVSGTVTDADSQTWNNGTYKFSTTALAQAPVTGSLSSTGTFTSVSIPHTSATGLVGDVWTLTVCPSFNYPCFNQSITVIGATQTVNPAPPAIRFSAVSPYQTQPSAYLDVEVTNGYQGFEYYNVTLGWRTCISVSASICTWNSSQSSGTGLQAFNTTTTCTTAATISTPCTTGSITIPNGGYADTNYRVVCTGLSPTAFPQIQTVTKSNTTFTITLNNLTAAAATYTSFDCLIGHN